MHSKSERHMLERRRGGAPTPPIVLRSPDRLEYLEARRHRYPHHFCHACGVRRTVVEDSFVRWNLLVFNRNLVSRVVPRFWKRYIPTWMQEKTRRPNQPRRFGKGGHGLLGQTILSWIMIRYQPQGWDGWDSQMEMSCLDDGGCHCHHWYCPSCLPQHVRDHGKARSALRDALDPFLAPDLVNIVWSMFKPAVESIHISN